MKKDFREIFLPSKPISDKSLFFGRNTQIDLLLENLKRPGIHPVIYGNRGVGKTSLVNVTLTYNEFCNRKIYFYSTNRKTTFHSFSVSLLSFLGLFGTFSEKANEDGDQFNASGGIFNFKIGLTTSKKTSETINSFKINEIGPWELFTFLNEINEKVIIVIDDLENAYIGKTDFAELLTDFIKVLTDRDCKSDPRIIIVGVAENVDAILSDHPSIERAIVEIQVPILEPEDLLLYLNATEERILESFEIEVKQKIAFDSLGYPYYVNLVALETLAITNKQNRKTANLSDLLEGINNAIYRAFHTELRKYKNVEYTLAYEEYLILEQIMLLIGFNSNISVDKVQEKLDYRKHLKDEDFYSHLEGLTSKNIITLKDGEIRFALPLFAPFFRRKILKINA